MPPHSSRFLQPLDIGCTSVIKKAYGDLILSKMRYGVNHIDKLEFLSEYPKARQSAFNKLSTIQNSFSGAGIIPSNPVVIQAAIGYHICLYALFIYSGS